MLKPKHSNHIMLIAQFANTLELKEVNLISFLILNWGKREIER